MNSLNPLSGKFLKIAAALLAILILACFESRAAINLTTFGADVDSFGDWTYTPATSTLSGDAADGDLLYPVNSPDPGWDFASLLGPGQFLVFNLTGFVTTSPGGGFQITIEDGSANQTATAFSYSSFGLTSSTVQVAVSTDSTPGEFDWSNVVNFNLVNSSIGTIDATFTNLEVAAVPEPSTYALLALSGVAFGGYIIRRRRRA
jgi:hypothetical protein